MKQINRLLLALILLVTGAPALHAADVRIIDVVAITWPGAPTPSPSSHGSLPPSAAARA